MCSWNTITVSPWAGDVHPPPQTPPNKKGTLFHQTFRWNLKWRVSWTLWAAILGVCFPLHKQYPYSLYRSGYLHFRYLKCLVIPSPMERVYLETPFFSLDRIRDFASFHDVLRSYLCILCLVISTTHLEKNLRKSTIALYLHFCGGEKNRKTLSMPIFSILISFCPSGISSHKNQPRA